jgi:hypothetical protein
MRNRNRILFGLMLIALVAAPLRAYRLALKDGQTIQFEKYRATETMLFYTGGDGKEIAIPLTDVDLNRTQHLNAQEPVPLDLPGLVPPGVANGSEKSLAEIARQQRKNTSGSAAKRVFTDDDVTHSSPAVPTVQTAPSEDTRLQTEPAQNIIDRLANKTPRQLANEVVGDIQFPGRDDWEQKLHGQGQRVLRFAQDYLDRAKKLDSITDSAQRSAATETAKNFEWQMNLEETTYTQIAAEGSQKAKESEKQPQ